MAGFSVSIFLILVGLAVVQGLLAVVFLRTLSGFRQVAPGEIARPKAAVVLCLRGRDPFLEKCLELLLAQDYPDYQLQVVVDSRQDPAWEVAQALVERYGAERVHIETLDDRRDTCSLKCSSVTQAIERLDGSFQIAALVDADTMPHATWLRDLAAPLADERVAQPRATAGICPRAARGARWCDTSGTPPPLCRCIGTKCPGVERWPSNAK